MRKLHLVGVTTDLKGLIFTARKGSKSGGYVVALDRKLLEAVDDASQRNGARPAASQPERSEKGPSRAGGIVAEDGSSMATPAAEVGEGRAQSALSPREMQARIRAGRSIEEVALEAGVGADWVARFAVPILAEQAQVVALARGITFAKPRLGPSALPLGEAVARNLAEKGHSLPEDLFDPAWSAFQLHDSVWTVRFRHEVRGRFYEAQWEIDVATGRLVARNRVASDLGYIDSGGRKRSDGATGDDGADPEPPPPSPSPGRPSRPGRPSSPGGRPPAGRRPEPQAPAGTPPSRRRSEPKNYAKASKEEGKAGPTIRGGGIRAATAQVASAQVAASRSLVARTVLPAPRPPVIPGSGTPSTRTGAGRPGPRSSGDTNGTADRAADPDASSDVFIGELLREPTTSEGSPADGRGSPPRREKAGRPERRTSGDDAGDRAGSDNLAAFQPRPRRQESPPAVPNVTRVRSGGPTGLVRTTSNSKARANQGDGGSGARGAGASRKPAADERDPVRVPSILSGASGPDRGMPVPPARSRRRLRRAR